jgi:BirA family biotin operon repressor/biotin-[acetyl-CoA-carboxylase] ligase
MVFSGPGLDERLLASLREAPGEYLSAGVLSQRLRVSSGFIRQQMSELRKQGYEIESHPHLGYRLISSPDLLLSQEIRHGLKTATMARQVLSYRRVRSTNEVALQIAHNGAPEGTLVVAESQTAGKGRLGRIWHSPPGVGLWVSLVLRPHMESSKVFQLAICGALAVAEALYQRTHLPVRVKWPNDVLIRGKKLAGVLTETQADGDLVQLVVLGMGINVNQDVDDFPEDLRNTATSVRAELGRPISRLNLLQDVLVQFEERYQKFQEGGLRPFLERWRQLSWVLNRKVKVQVGGRLFSGLAVDIEDTGALVLEEASGKRQRLLAGDVSFQ